MYIPDYIEMIHGVAFPGAPVARQLFYRDDLNLWYIYDGTAWVSLMGGMVIHGNPWHNPAFATEADLLAETLARALADFMHAAITAPPIHGSAVAAAFDTLVHRDPTGRAQIIDPAVAADIDNMGARDAAILLEAAARNAAIAAHALLPDAHHARDHHARHEPGGGDPMAVDAAAGTGSLRTLAGSGVALSAARSDHTHTLQDDLIHSEIDGNVTGSSGTYYRYQRSFARTEIKLILTETDTFAANSRQFFVCWFHGQCSHASALKLQLYVDGIFRIQSPHIDNDDDDHEVVKWTGACSGLTVVQVKLRNFQPVVVYAQYYCGENYIYEAVGLAHCSIKI